MGPDTQTDDDLTDFIMYPAYIDLDNDGIADGEEIKMEIKSPYSRANIKMIKKLN